MIVASLASLLFTSTADASNWGDFKDDGCVKIENGVAYRQYSAILWNIPWGASWGDACRATAGTGPTAGYSAARCPEAGGHQWGEFEIPDGNCAPNWGDFKDDGCVGQNTRQFSAILWNVPQGVSWEAACRQWPAGISGPQGVQSFGHASRCVNHAGNMWGEFDYVDATCN